MKFCAVHYSRTRGRRRADVSKRRAHITAEMANVFALCTLSRNTDTEIKCVRSRRARSLGDYLQRITKPTHNGT